MNTLYVELVIGTKLDKLEVYDIKSIRQLSATTFLIETKTPIILI